MELKKMQIKMLSCCFLAGGLTLAGCSTDDSIDVGDVDTTIGVKLNNFTVPLGQAEKITLGDVLDLKDDDCISTNANGDYEFSIRAMPQILPIHRLTSSMCQRRHLRTRILLSVLLRNLPVLISYL